MTLHKTSTLILTLLVVATVSACGSRNSNDQPYTYTGETETTKNPNLERVEDNPVDQSTSIWDLFGTNKPDQTVNVNRFLWNASLDVLSFLPVQSVDPFTGVIVTGYGTPPGGGRSYRATVFITDPALDARSLRVALQTRGGPVSAATARAVENAILSRARQMRVADNNL
jgi:Domain of unknown function (DUF3576)